MRLATFNVENMFERPEAMNQDASYRESRSACLLTQATAAC